MCGLRRVSVPCPFPQPLAHTFHLRQFYDPSRLSRWDAQLPTALEAASASPEAATAETQRLLASLGDPYTKLMPSSEFRRFRAANDGVLTGVGCALLQARLILKTHSSAFLLLTTARQASPHLRAGDGEIAR